MKRDVVLDLHVPEHGDALLQPWGGVLPSDQSLVVTEIIVPPIEPEPDLKEELRLRVGDKYELMMPLRLFTDSYRAGLAGAVSRLRGTERETLDHTLRRIFCSLEEHAEAYGPDHASLVWELTQALRRFTGRSFLGIAPDPAILVPPRQTFSVSTTGTSTPTVWLRGIVSLP